MKRANKISHHEWQKAFLENTPEHIAVVKMWNEMGADEM
jgi:hypothetical protein